MEFRLPEEIADLARELHRWADVTVSSGTAERSPFAPERWSDFLRWDLLDDDAATPEAMLRTAVAFMEVARGRLPGPVLEAYLAVAAGSSEARAALDAGHVVSSV
jgi:hypothetical protein